MNVPNPSKDDRTCFLCEGTGIMTYIAQQEELPPGFTAVSNCLIMSCKCTQCDGTGKWEPKKKH